LVCKWFLATTEPELASSINLTFRPDFRGLDTQLVPFPWILEAVLFILLLGYNVLVSPGVIRWG
jgi:hypothetical protein